MKGNGIGESAAPARSPRVHLGRAALTLLGFASFCAVLWAGIFPCFSARYLHVPCPACGSTRATKALLTLDFAGWLRMNPLGPVMAALFALFAARAVLVMARDGTLRRLADGRLGTALPYAMLATFLGEVVVWALRFFGLFGGPCPV